MSLQPAHPIRVPYWIGQSELTRQALLDAHSSFIYDTLVSPTASNNLFLSFLEAVAGYFLSSVARPHHLTEVLVN